MSTLPKTFLTEEQYLEIERAAELKSASTSMARCTRCPAHEKGTT